MRQSPKRRQTLGIIGCGTIARVVARAISLQSIPVRHVVVYDVEQSRAKVLSAGLRRCTVARTLEALIEACDIAIECASARAVGTIVRQARVHNTQLIIMSVGGLLLDPTLRRHIHRLPAHVHIPSGAIAGLDALRAAREGGLSQVRLTTTKPPQGLAGAPYVTARKIDLNRITTKTVIFEGGVEEAVRAFPANINVAAAIAVAIGDPKLLTVCVIADPAATRNTHEIAAQGTFGSLLTRTENLPSPDNPKTSYLASLSALFLLRSLIPPRQRGMTVT